MRPLVVLTPNLEKTSRTLATSSADGNPHAPRKEIQGRGCGTSSRRGCAAGSRRPTPRRGARRTARSPRRCPPSRSGPGRAGKDTRTGASAAMSSALARMRPLGTPVSRSCSALSMHLRSSSTRSVQARDLPELRLAGVAGRVEHGGDPGLPAAAEERRREPGGRTAARRRRSVSPRPCRRRASRAR